jgi:hypothetical protein
MKWIRTKTSWRNIVTFLTVVCTFTACSTTQIAPTFNIERPDLYKQNQEQDGLSVAVQPIVSQDELQTFFGDNLLKKGILPVLIVVENRNKTQTYLISIEQISLESDSSGNADSSHGSVAASSLDTRKATYKKSKEGIGTVAVGALVGGLVTAAILLPAAFIDWGPTEHSKAVQHNIVAKSLGKKTLSQDQRHSGCIYITVPPDISIDATTLVVTMEEIAGGLPLRFEFPLNISTNSNPETKK